MNELVTIWRNEARNLLQTLEQRETLLMCAEQLERWHHDNYHNGEWSDGCPHCDQERKEESA